jgi:hypothetical protein
MPNDFTYDVFLSHSAKDTPVVRELANRLKHDGLRVWLDESEIQPGDMIGLKIQQGLERSRTLLMVMSNAYFLHWACSRREKPSPRIRFGIVMQDDDDEEVEEDYDEEEVFVEPIDEIDNNRKRRNAAKVNRRRAMARKSRRLNRKKKNKK